MSLIDRCYSKRFIKGKIIEIKSKKETNTSWQQNTKQTKYLDLKDIKSSWFA